MRFEGGGEGGVVVEEDGQREKVRMVFVLEVGREVVVIRFVEDERLFRSNILELRVVASRKSERGGVDGSQSYRAQIRERELCEACE